MWQQGMEGELTTQRLKAELQRKGEEGAWCWVLNKYRADSDGGSHHSFWIKHSLSKLGFSEMSQLLVIEHKAIDHSPTLTWSSCDGLCPRLWRLLTLSRSTCLQSCPSGEAERKRKVITPCLLKNGDCLIPFLRWREGKNTSLYRLRKKIDVTSHLCSWSKTAVPQCVWHASVPGTWTCQAKRMWIMSYQTRNQEPRNP